MTVALYVPGDRPDRFEKAMASGADIVILDLEDAVAPAAKQEARAAVARLLEHQAASPASRVALQVRIEAGSSDDLAMLEAFDVDIRLPKVRTPADVDAVVDRVDRPVHALVEDAIGLQALPAIAAHRSVVSLTLGESDLVSDLGSSSGAMLTHARIQLVIACRAAGLPMPLMAAYPRIRDLDGLAADCREGAELGYQGRTAVHPSQIAVIRQAFAPGAEAVAWATEVVAVLERGGVATLASGDMVDAAMLGRARSILERRV